MRRMLLVAATLAATAPAMGQTSNPEKELTALAKEVDAAFARNDAAFFDRLNADDWTLINPEGEAQSKAQVLKEMKDGTFKVESSETLEMKVRAYGDAGVVIGRSRLKAMYKGKPISSTDRWTDVYIKRDGKWQCVASQVTHVAVESGGKKP
jgi:ketosteroid isomerase-like protein